MMSHVKCLEWFFLRKMLQGKKQVKNTVAVEVRHSKASDDTD